MTARSGAYRCTRAGMVALLMVSGATGAAACSSSSSPKATKRPTTNAKLAIVSPAPNAVVPPTIQLEFKLTNGKVVPATSTALRGDEGHIHVSVDGRIVSMAYGTSQTVPNLSAGEHTIAAEFVAADHIPFANRRNVIVRII